MRTESAAQFRFKNSALMTAVAAFLLLGMGLTTMACGKKDHAGHAIKGVIYYCPMHPQIQQSKPGTCPICSMDLVPMEFPKESMEMKGDGIPESLKGLAQVHLSSWKQQLIGLRTEMVEKRPVTRMIRTVGRFGGGGFAAAASDFAVSGWSSSGESRYVVADVYALDQSFVRIGQTAWVSPLEGSMAKVKARVAQIYPYDETQSRVVRVRLNLEKPLRGGLFANVEIEAASGVRLALSNDAVMDTGTVRYAFVEAAPGHFEPREVFLGLRGEDSWEILSGLKQGEKVVVNANFLVDADAKLKAVLAGMSAATEQHKH